MFQRIRVNFYLWPVLGFVLAFLLMPLCQTASAQVPTVLKASTRVKLHSYEYFYQKPTDQNAQEYMGSWVPYMTFYVVGPIPASSLLQVEVYHPKTNKLWLTLDCQTPAVAEGAVQWIQTPTVQNQQAIMDTGPVEFKIRFKNELAGVDQVLFTGKFKVNKYLPTNYVIPKFKNMFTYFVDYDWQLPMGYMYWSQIYADDPNSRLNLIMWFKGATDATQLAAHLFFNGKEVSSTYTDASKVNDLDSYTVSNSSAMVDQSWESFIFHFASVRLLNTQFDGDLVLSPGEYEIKVLRNKKLARSMKFQVGSDGRITDNNLGAQNNIYNFFLFPVSVLGDQDGKWDKNAWKTDLFFGNPLKGFIAIQ